MLFAINIDCGGNAISAFPLVKTDAGESAGTDIDNRAHGFVVVNYAGLLY